MLSPETISLAYSKFSLSEKKVATENSMHSLHRSPWKAIGKLPQGVSEMGYKCGHLVLVPVQVEDQPDLRPLGSMTRRPSSLLGLLLLTARTAGTGSQAPKCVVPCRLGGEREGEGVLPYTHLSHCYVSVT